MIGFPFPVRALSFARAFAVPHCFLYLRGGGFRLHADWVAAGRGCFPRVNYHYQRLQ